MRHVWLLRHLSAAFVLLPLGASPRDSRSLPELVSRAAPSRVAAIPDTTDDLRIDINVPAFRLEVRENDSVTAVYRIAVGMRAFPTPIGDFQMDYLVWNPSWTPPDKPWARGQRAQAPGPANWMGRVKLHVTGLVFIHGSPFETSLGTAASHACMRMRNGDAIALARTVLRRAGAELAPALLDSLEGDPRRTRVVQLLRSVPVHIRYELREQRGDTTINHRDIYRRGRR